MAGNKLLVCNLLQTETKINKYNKFHCLSAGVFSHCSVYAYIYIYPVQTQHLHFWILFECFELFLFIYLFVIEYCSKDKQKK